MARSRGIPTKIGLHSAKSDPGSTKFDQNWPGNGPIWLNFDQSWPEFWATKGGGAINVLERLLVQRSVDVRANTCNGNDSGTTNANGNCNGNGNGNNDVVVPLITLVMISGMTTIMIWK